MIETAEYACSSSTQVIFGYRLGIRFYALHTRHDTALRVSAFRFTRPPRLTTLSVEPNLQPPSPNPPSTTLRGLYLLAGIIAAFIGAGLGLFLYKFAKYFVATAGGFTFAWYLLATKSGGLISSVLGRWGLLGGLAVGTLVLSIVPKMVEPMMLVSTAWIGATAFVLGIDCFTRAGLKEVSESVDYIAPKLTS